MENTPIQNPVLYCDKCGKQYAAHQLVSTESGYLPLQCSCCFTIRHVSPTPIAVLLQPVIGSNDTTGLLVAWSDERENPGYKELTLPKSHIRLTESPEDAIVRTTEENIGITLKTNTLKIFDITSDLQKQRVFLFYENTQRIHQRELSLFKKKTEVWAVQVIQTTYGMDFVCPSYQEAADKFINNMWRHFRS